PAPSSMYRLSLHDALPISPIGSMLVRVFYDGDRFSFDTFRDVFASNSLYEILLNTLVVVVLGSVCAFVVGSLFAWLNERTDARIDRKSTRLSSSHVKISYA